MDIDQLRKCFLKKFISYLVALWIQVEMNVNGIPVNWDGLNRTEAAIGDAACNNVTLPIFHRFIFLANLRLLWMEIQTFGGIFQHRNMKMCHLYYFNFFVIHLQPSYRGFS